MKEALKTVAVGGGSSAEYLEGEYIRLVLNMLVGQGMWELKTNVDSYDVRTVKHQLFDNNRRKTGTEDRLGVSAVIHTQLIISARSEEHTSELQSLMRISYAVFCLKKKTIK